MAARSRVGVVFERSDRAQGSMRDGEREGEIQSVYLSGRAHHDVDPRRSRPSSRGFSWRASVAGRREVGKGRHGGREGPSAAALHRRGDPHRRRLGLRAAEPQRGGARCVAQHMWQRHMGCQCNMGPSRVPQSSSCSEGGDIGDGASRSVTRRPKSVGLADLQFLKAGRVASPCCPEPLVT